MTIKALHLDMTTPPASFRVGDLLKIQRYPHAKITEIIEKEENGQMAPVKIYLVKIRYRFQLNAEGYRYVDTIWQKIPGYLARIEY